MHLLHVHGNTYPSRRRREKDTNPLALLTSNELTPTLQWSTVMSMVVRLDQVWEVYSVRARAWIRATVTGLTADSATLDYESFPGSITVDLWIMRFEPTRFRRANSSTGDLVENEQASENAARFMSSAPLLANASSDRASLQPSATPAFSD
jgi:hypothetical protein